MQRYKYSPLVIFTVGLLGLVGEAESKFSSNASTECQHSLSLAFNKIYPINFDKEIFKIVKQIHVNTEVNYVYLYYKGKLVRQAAFICYFKDSDKLFTIEGVNGTGRNKIERLLKDTNP